MMLVVADTSPVTALLQIGQASILPTLFGEVLVPSAVESELLRFHHSLPDYLGIKAIQDHRTAEMLCRELDRGEAEAIVLAEESRADFLLMDEKHGRAVAEARGLRVTGLLGVLLMAKKAGIVAELGQLLTQLESQAGFFVSERVKKLALTAAGEC
jgi:uncharacterized protein